MSFASIKSALGKAYARFLKGKSDDLEKSFLEAAEQNNLAEISRCIEDGVDPNCKDTDLCTALHIAAERGDMVLAMKLFECSNIKINPKNFNGKTPLHIACNNEHIRMVKFLLQNDADPNARDRFERTPLHAVVYANSTVLVRLLIENGAAVNVIDSMGNTPLHIAAIEKSYLTMVKLLIQCGANPNMGTGNLSLLLECALACHRRKMLIIICYLLDHDAQINDTDKISGRNALHFVGISGYAPLTSELLKRGCDPFKKDLYGKMPVDIANTHGNEEVAFILESRMYPFLYPSYSQDYA